MIDFLSYNVNTDYRFIKPVACVYHVKSNTAIITFFYDEKVAKTLESLQDRLEKECRAKIDSDVKLVFEYKKAYTDELLLKMEIKKFLIREFSILTLSLTDEDIHVERNGEVFKINLHLPPQSIDYIRNNKLFTRFAAKLHDENFCTFEFFFDAKKTSEQDGTRALEKLEQYMKNSVLVEDMVKVDKSLRVKNIEYWLGKPIKERPVKVEFIRTCPDEQVTAGEIKFLTKREFTKGEETKTYWTFVIDDGKTRLQCVFFPTDKTGPKFDKLVNGTVVCVIGTNSERNGRTSFRVSGVSFCEMT